MLGYVTPPVPFVTQNSMSRVTPEIANRAAAANSQRPKPRPVSHDTTAPSTAPPAPTGAITLPTQLMKFRNAPSGCAPLSPWTATFEAGELPRFCAHPNGPIAMSATANNAISILALAFGAIFIDYALLICSLF